MQDPQQQAAKKGGIAKDVLVAALIFLASFQFPWESYTGLDYDAQAMIEYWTMNRYQYGKDIDVNVGPFGFINYPAIYTGFLDKEKFLINLGLSTLFVGLVMALSRRFQDSTGRKLLLLFTALFSSTWFVTPYSNMDTKLYLLMLAIVYTLFASRSGKAVFLLFPVLALLSLAKGTLLYVALAVTCAASLHFLLTRSMAQALAAWGVYSLSLVCLWSAIGQNLAHLPQFIGNMLGLTSGYAVGYTESAALFEPVYMTFLGVSCVLAAGFSILLRHLSGLRGLTPTQVLSQTLCMLVEAFILFVVWKHSFVRADGHVIVLFHFLVVALAFFFWTPPFAETNEAVEHPAIRRAYLWATALALLGCGFAMHYVMQTSLRPLPTAVLNVKLAMNAPDIIEGLKTSVARIRDERQLPKTQALVGDAPIGYFGFEPLVMLHNHFNYRPMPKVIPFTGWDKESMEKDAEFFRNRATAPDYLLYRQITIDSRIASQDDALAQLEIFSGYDPVEDEATAVESGKHLLMKRRELAPAGPVRFLPYSVIKNAMVGDWIKVPNAALPMRVRVTLSPAEWGQALRTFYKPPEYIMEYELDGGDKTTRRFIPIMAEQGFLVAPFIETNFDLRNALDKTIYVGYQEGKRDPLTRISGFRISCRQLTFACAAKMRIEFETVEGLDLGRLSSRQP